MPKLIVLPWGCGVSDVANSPLISSLRKQTCKSWRLLSAPFVLSASTPITEGGKGFEAERDAVDKGAGSVGVVDKGANGVGGGSGFGVEDVLVWLPADATLLPEFCATILRTFAQNPETAALYGDIEISGRRMARSAWSPTRVQSEQGFTMPLAVRAETLIAMGMSYDADPFEVEARLASTNMTVLHIPGTLTSHPRNLPVSTRAYHDDLLFEPGSRPGIRRRRPWLQGQEQVSVVVPSAGVKPQGSERSMLMGCLESISRLDPLPEQVMVVIGDEFDSNSHTDLHLMVDDRLCERLQVVHRGSGGFNFSIAVNQGILASEGEFVLILNDDIEATSSDWLGRMVAHLQVASVGAVGAALLYPDHTVQHVGMVIHSSFCRLDAG